MRFRHRTLGHTVNVAADSPDAARFRRLFTWEEATGDAKAPAEKAARPRAKRAPRKPAVSAPATAPEVDAPTP